MLSFESDSKRTGIAVALSLIVHALLLLLMPGFNAPIGYSRLGDSLPIDVTIVPMLPEEEVTTQVVTTKSPIVQPADKPIVTPVKEQPKPVEKPVTPEPKEEAPRVLTTTNPVAPVDTVPTEPDVEPEPESVPEPEVVEPQPPPPPLQREAVSGLGILISYPSKEAAFLRTSTQVQVVVTVKPQDSPKGRLVGTTGSDELDRWVLLWSERRFNYTAWSDPYEVQFVAKINPHTRSVTFDLLEPDNRVHIVQP